MTDKNMLEWDPERQTEIISACLMVMPCNPISKALSYLRMYGMESAVLEKMSMLFSENNINRHNKKYE
jgi:hypothetical protein